MNREFAKLTECTTAISKTTPQKTKCFIGNSKTVGNRYVSSSTYQFPTVLFRTATKTPKRGVTWTHRTLCSKKSREKSQTAFCFWHFRFCPYAAPLFISFVSPKTV